MYNVNYGVINHLLVQFGMVNQPVGFLSDPALALLSIIVVVIWSGTPFFTLMLLAAMQAVPEELYEAARMDGATPVQRVWRITLPLILPTIAVTCLLRIIWVANYVDIPFAMTGGGPGYATMTLPVYVFIKAESALDMGYASAMALILGALLTGLVFLYLRFLRRWEVQVG
jgi:multiple sugar transport system permease protein